MSVRAALIWLFLAAAAHGQGFAGLGDPGGTGFAPASPDTRLSFPADHGAHPDHRIEWWYLTANLTDASGAPLGVQWTLFRSALAPRRGTGWNDPQLWLAHSALTTASTHHSAEKLARGGVGQAGVVAMPFEAWIDDWELSGDLAGQARVRAGGEGFSYDLALSARGPLVLHGQQGYSVKSPQGQASHYYSQPFFEVTGTVLLEGQPRQVSGTAWLDREWSSQPLQADQLGWDWVSLSLDGGSRLMGFQVRSSDGTAFTSGTWIAPDGAATPISNGDLTLQPARMATSAGAQVPVEWRVLWPEKGLDVQVSALNPDAWMQHRFTYWEGPVSVSGTHRGRGYLEMTGYK